MKYTYPHKIDNGGGEELTFVRNIVNEAEQILEVENSVQRGAGPPMHIHWLQDESITVVQGKIGVQIAGQKSTFHGPGETLTFRRGVPHRFWNAGEDILICKGWITPANNVEYFLTEIYRSTKTNGGKRPSAFDAAYLQTKYHTEFDMVEIPKFVKKVIFPFIVMIGNLTGQYHKFNKAPDAVKGRV
jgi:quercetin dioxygenase-like cupin family protein